MTVPKHSFRDSYRSQVPSRKPQVMTMQNFNRRYLNAKPSGSQDAPERVSSTQDKKQVIKVMRKTYGIEEEKKSQDPVL